MYSGLICHFEHTSRNHTTGLIKISMNKVPTIEMVAEELTLNVGYLSLAFLYEEELRNCLTCHHSFSLTVTNFYIFTYAQLLSEKVGLWMFHWWVWSVSIFHFEKLVTMYSPKQNVFHFFSISFQKMKIAVSVNI